MSFLYIISNQNQYPVKVGFSKNPDKRVKQLQTGNFEKLSIQYLEEVDDDKVKIAEKFIHKILNHKQINGEWFNITVDEAKSELTYARIMIS